MIDFYTTHGAKITSDNITIYLDRVIGKLYKILPMYENQEGSVNVYTDSLQIEIEGFIGAVSKLNDDPIYISLLSVVQWINSNISTCEFKKLRREVFHAINICNKIQEQYADKA